MIEQNNPEQTIHPSTHIDTMFVFRWKDLENGFNAHCTSDINELQKIKETNGEWWLTVGKEIFIPNEKDEYILRARIKAFEVLFTAEKRRLSDSTQRGDDNDYYCTVYIAIEAI